MVWVVVCACVVCVVCVVTCVLVLQVPLVVYKCAYVCGWLCGCVVVDLLYFSVYVCGRVRVCGCMLYGCVAARTVCWCVCT